MVYRDPRQAPIQQAQQRDDEEIAKNPKPPTISYEDRANEIVRKVSGRVTIDPKRAKAIKRELIDRNITHDPRNGDRRTRLLSGYEVPFGDEQLENELVAREDELLTHGGKTVAGHLEEHLVGLDVPQEKAQQYRTQIRGLSDGRVAVRPPGAQNEMIADDLAQGLRLLVPAILRDIELDRRRAAAAPLIEELAKEQRQRRHGLRGSSERLP